MTADRSAWGATLFCDDIRYEVGGKTTIIGIYQSDMLFPLETAFPITISRLSMLVRYYEFKGEMNGDVTFKIFLPAQEEPVVFSYISRDQINAAPAPYAPDGDSESVFNVVMPIILSPFTLHGEGPIKIRAFCGDRLVRLGRLVVRKMTEAEQAIFLTTAFPQPPSQPLPAAPAS